MKNDDPSRNAPRLEEGHDSGLVARVIGGALLVWLTVGGAAAAPQKLQPTVAAAANENVEFDVFLPLRHAQELDKLLVALHTPSSPSYHRWLTPDEFRARFGAKPETIARVSEALASYGLAVTRAHTHGVHVEGTAESVGSAFGVKLWHARTDRGADTLIAGERLRLPAALREAGALVVAFSPMIRHRAHSRQVGIIPDNRYSPIGAYWFDDLKQAYDFPSYKSLNGRGQTIGIVMAGDFLDSDMFKYFTHEKLRPPKIVRVPIDGGGAFDPNGSVEVSLDIQQAGGMAPGATIMDFNLPDLSDQSILDAYVTIVERNDVDIVSSSFGAAEGLYTAAYNGGTDYTWILRLFDQVYKQGNAQGITFVASSGDEGGLALPPLGYFTTPPRDPPVARGKFLPGIDDPASSPHVTAVGGTNLVTTYRPPSLRSEYVRENAYGDPLAPFDPYGVGNLIEGGYWGSGGGVSVVFPKPDYQFLVATRSRMRTIPDVSLQMGGCPVGTLTACGPDRSYVVAVVGGQGIGLIGTSVSAPDFAGLLALEEENLGGVRLGNVNYQIYGLAAAEAAGFGLQVYHEGIPGFNGYYYTHSGYNMVIGNGTVFGRNFIFAPGVPPAGDPQTPSNP